MTLTKPRFQKAKREAEQLLEKYEIANSPVPVERIAKREGARIQFGPLDKELSGMFFVKDGVPTIGVNSLHHPNRQRFSLAHELGHMMLHADIIKGIHVDKGNAILQRAALAAEGTDPMEIEANQFAANLLVPDFLLSSILGDDYTISDDEEELEALSKKFKVSTVMIQLRLVKWMDSKRR